MYKLCLVYQNNITEQEQCFYEYGSEYYYKKLAEAHAIALRNSLKNDGIDKHVQVYVIESV